MLQLTLKVMLSVYKSNANYCKKVYAIIVMPTSITETKPPITIRRVWCSDVWRPRSPVIVRLIFQLTDHFYAQPDKSLITFTSKWSPEEDRTGHLTY